MKRNKNDNDPSKVCQYGAKCYRKNPTHFKEYFHKHLDDIMSTGKDSSTSEYTIPDEYFMSKDIIAEQLEILEKLFPNQKTSTPDDDPKSTTPAKKQKTDLKQSDKPQSASLSVSNQKSSSTDDEPKSSTSVTKPTEKPQSASFSSDNNARKITAEQLKRSLNETFNKTETPKLSKDQNDGASTSKQAFSTKNTDVIKTPSTPSQNPKPPKNIHDYINVVLPKGNMAKKLEQAAPYNFFLTTITASKPTHNEPLSITFQEILDPSLGDLESSVQINFMVDAGWLLGHYYFAGHLDKPMLILHGEDTPELQTISTKKPQITAIKVNMSSPFATHHTKMMILGYKDGSMRIVVSTANLYIDDWENRTQGLWISPKCQPLSVDADTASGESITEFRESLERYLVTYNIPKLQPWIARVRKTDFSKINVFLVTSVPGGHRELPGKGYLFGHGRVAHLLGKHSAPIDDSCPVVAQSSSIGSLGPNIQTWINSDIVPSFRRDSAPIGIRRLPAFKMIYPSFGNVKNSHDDLLGGGCLPYSKQVNEKQPWLKSYLHQWKSNGRHRTRAMPHIKTYCRWSDRGLYWFLLTSANLSKAAMGAFNKSAKLDAPLRINNYEAGVLYLPKFVVNENTKFFPLNGSKDGVPQFPMPYDIPLTQYKVEDHPFLMDYLR